MVLPTPLRLDMPVSSGCTRVQSNVSPQFRSHPISISSSSSFLCFETHSSGNISRSWLSSSMTGFSFFVSFAEASASSLPLIGVCLSIQSWGFSKYTHFWGEFIQSHGFKNPGGEGSLIFLFSLGITDSYNYLPFYHLLLPSGVSNLNF